MMNERHRGYEIDCDYLWVNHLINLKQHNSQRFDEFYSQGSIYYYLDKLQHEHLTPD